MTLPRADHTTQGGLKMTLNLAWAIFCMAFYLAILVLFILKG